MQNDSQAMKEGVSYMQTAMINDYTNRAIEQFLQTSNIYTGSNWDYQDFVNAIGLLNREGYEGFTILINPLDELAVKKQLESHLKYVEGFVKDSYIGHVCNLPIISSKAIPQNTAIISNKAAVKAIMKTGTQVETSREPSTRTNRMFIRKHDVVALVREDLCVMMIGNGASKLDIVPECSNVGAQCVTEADGTIRVVGEAVEAGVPTAWASEFPKPLTNGVIVNLKGIIPSTGATITQTNIALAAYADDANVKKVGKTYQKTKNYDGTDSDLQLIIQYGKQATVKVGDVVYRIKGDFICKHTEGTIL